MTAGYLWKGKGSHTTKGPDGVLSQSQMSSLRCRALKGSCYSGEAHGLTGNVGLRGGSRDVLIVGACARKRGFWRLPLCGEADRHFRKGGGRKGVRHSWKEAPAFLLAGAVHDPLLYSIAGATSAEKGLCCSCT